MAFGKFTQLYTEQKSYTPSQQTDKPVVLVIDDDPGIRNGLRINLGKTYEVLLGANGEEGIRAVNEQVHAIVLDIKMPGMNGFEVYDRIKAHYPDIPIIFYSAYQNVLEAAKVDKQYRPFSYFDKSSDVKGLLDIVHRAVKHYSSILEITSIGQRIETMSKKKPLS